MPRKSRHAVRIEKAVLAFSPGNRIMSEDHFLDELRPLGLTRKSFRALLAALSVPTIEIGSTRFLDVFSFSLALRAILRIGEPDFLAPTSESLRKGRVRGRATRLDTASFERNTEIVIRELLSIRQMSGITLRKDTVSAAREAARRMALAGVASLPLNAQATYDARIPPLPGALP